MKKRIKVSQGNRGMAFENILERVNAQYDRENIAVINKRPTPVKVLKVRMGRIQDGHYEKKSTVDYDGTYKGKAVYFEAKSTIETTRFDLDNIHMHQVEFLEKAQRHGAICFFLIEFAKKGEVYFVTLPVIQMALLHASTGGRQSIAYKDFKEYAYLIPKTKRALLDYLIYVDKLIEESAA
ncbi:Holliday junction resolvase RecU [Brevibacterium sp. JNUCC-42]|nr:Holliday junction resolvase RecU [Brevibacterium sp. JNUCC-42]